MNTAHTHHGQQSRPTHHDDQELDVNVVEKWLRWDPTRWLAGAAAGLFAGLVTLAFAGIVTVAAGGADFWFPTKLMASIPMGAQATEYGFHAPSIFVGLMFFEFFALIWGVIYAHFVYTNSLPSLLSMGLVWGTFSWIFIWNLFLPSFKTVVAAQLPSSPVFLICLVYGLSLTAVAFFDRAMRGNR
jgi:hypothetical protein